MNTGMPVVVVLGLFLLRGMDNFAHIGGFAMGILAGLALIPTKYADKMERRLKIASQSGAAVTAVVLQVMMLAAFYLNTAEKVCPWCKHLKCVPTGVNRC